MRIGLFTPFSPQIGGGSVQLRSHLAQIADLDIVWHYRAAAALPGKNWRWLGKPLTPIQFAADISSRSGYLPGSTEAVREVVAQMNADLYWIVAHYEGISVAAELLAQGKKVHLTVHDEPLGMVVRSRRYWALYPLVGPLFKKILLGAESVDVTSWGMRDYFKAKYGVKCFSLYRSLLELPPVKSTLQANTLRVGHIGSLYQMEPFRKFLKALQECAAGQNLTVKVVRIGNSPEMDAIAAEEPDAFENCGELEERDALPILANCDFLYAMYPHGHRFGQFRRTSLPIKLSTYIQAQRPIFAQTPEDSGLAQVVSQYQVGCVCGSDDHARLKEQIGTILISQVSRERFEVLRNELMGEKQIQQLRKALTLEE